jgi:predicted signal transduction protein with EAL and GGDEF domain
MLETKLRASASPAPTRAGEHVANRRILLVDDNRAIHEDFRKVLGARADTDGELDALHAELFGSGEQARARTFELTSAFQGEEAVALVSAARAIGAPYALAFVDVRMPPGIDGVETTRRMLSADPDIGIVVCSAYSDHRWEQMAAAFGDTDRVLILKKPFDTVEVRQLAHALERRWELARVAALKLEELAGMVDARTSELRAANSTLEVEARRREAVLRELRESHEQIRVLAYHDGLTGLPNRRRFNELLDRSLAGARRAGDALAVMFVDFDNFKRINDSVGHHAADAVLRQLASALTRIVRAGDVVSRDRIEVAGHDMSIDDATVVSRVGGDEFVILLPCTRDRLVAGNVAQRILSHMSEPIRTGEHELFVTASIGIATFPDDGDTAETLLRNADTAMYHAKELGKAGYQYYSEAMNVASAERVALESALRRAIAQEQLSLAYQPQVDLRTGRIVGAEALLRWRDPQRGDISPGVFIPLAEETGLILPLSEWVLNQACFQAMEWQRAGLPAVPIAVNVSGVQFSRQDVSAVVRRALALSGLSPGLLGVEITETAMMPVRDRAVALLGELRSLGVQLSLDDFGTGYSSLSYLKRFPLHSLKIDRTFVTEIVSDAHTASITQAIITMAHVLGLRVIAEGVETEAEFELLRTWGCDAIQGHYLSAAVTAERFAALLGGAPLNGAPRRAAIGGS